MDKQFLNKETLKRYISDNRLNETIKILLFQLNEFLDKNENDQDYEPIRKLSDALTINSGKLNGLEHDKIIGILDRETQRITSAEVQNAVLYIIDQLPNQFWNFKKVDNEISYKSHLIEVVEILHKHKSKFDYDIFICFSTKDREISKPIWEMLRGYGLKVFVSDEDLQNTVGFNFLDKIDNAIVNSQHLVLLASTNAFNSVYVQDEYQAFYNDCHVKNPKNRLLIVYKLDNFQIAELPRILRNKQIATHPEQIVKTILFENEKKEIAKLKILGNHQLTLQWISWDYTGVVKIEKINNLIECSGQQLSKEHLGDFLKINGFVDIINENEFILNGTIITKIHHINNGNECLRKGNFHFRAIGERKYWRMKEQLNPCEPVTDYIDIYFKKI